MGSERLGAGQHRARAKARAKGRAGCRAGRAQAGCRGRAQGCKISILRFSRPENLKITFLQLFEKKGEGRAGQGLGSERLGAGQHRPGPRPGPREGQVQGRQGAGRVQGQGTEGRAGLQDSILRFSRAENLKITFLQLFEAQLTRGQGQGQGRAGRTQAGCRAQGAGAGAGHKGQGRVARFHFEVFKAPKPQK